MTTSQATTGTWTQGAFKGFGNTAANTGNSSPWTNYTANNQFTGKSTYSTYGTGTALGTSATSKEVKSGLTFPEFVSDTINDICINNHKIVAAATWNGIKIWENNPTTQTTTATTGFTSQTTVQYNFESYENILEDKQMIAHHNEPVLRCTFDTLQNNVIYFGNAFGRIFKVYLEGNNKEEYAGHQSDMITGLKYCRDKCLVASSSCDGLCYLWDPRKIPIGCAEIKTNINCTNLDFVHDTVAICGIDMAKNTPILKLYDIRYLTNPAPPAALSTYTFSATTTAKTAVATDPVSKSLIVEYGQNLTENDLLQFSSIVLDHSGKNFIAGTLGGFIINSKISQVQSQPATALATATTTTKYLFEESFLYPKAAKTTANAFQNQQTNVVFNAINCLAVVPTLVRKTDLTGNGVFAGMSNGFIVSLSGFRTNSNATVKKDVSTALNVINRNYMNIKDGLPVTACAVSPNGKYLVYAEGDDFSKGIGTHLPKNENSTSEATDIPTKVRFKTIDLEGEFKKSNSF